MIPLVEELESRLTPTTCVATPPGEPTPATCVDVCVHESMEDLLLDGAAAASSALVIADEVEVEIETETDVEVEEFVWAPPPTNPFVAQYRNLSDAELYQKAKDVKARALDLLAQVQALQDHSYSGIVGWGQAVIDAAKLPYLKMSIHETRLQLEALTQIHNSRT